MKMLETFDAFVANTFSVKMTPKYLSVSTIIIAKVFFSVDYSVDTVMQIM